MQTNTLALPIIQQTAAPAPTFPFLDEYTLHKRTKTTQIMSFTFHSDNNLYSLMWQDISPKCGMNFFPLKYIREHTYTYIIHRQTNFISNIFSLLQNISIVEEFSF